ncbi:hypothetical protein [Schlesneria sp.]|uniref:hypothetical protein n=1 Tax=Schlesneria sp. TaxID=2762018 RepID=UPI002F115159
MFFETGVQSQSIVARVFDDTGLPVAGLNAAGMPTVKAVRAGAFAAVTIGLVNLASATDAWTEGGLWSYGDGTYRIDLPNSIFASPGRVTIWGEASGKRLDVDTIEVGVLAAIGTAVTAIANSLTAIGVIVAAVKDKTDNLPFEPAAVGSQMDLVADPNAAAIGAIVDAVFAGGSIDGADLQGVLRLIAAAVIGKVSGLPGTSIAQRAIDDSKVRISVVQDANGNVTSVTTDAS